MRNVHENIANQLDYPFSLCPAYVLQMLHFAFQFSKFFNSRQVHYNADK